MELSDGKDFCYVLRQYRSVSDRRTHRRIDATDRRNCYVNMR